MTSAAHSAVFEVLANKTSYAVLDECWNARNGRKPLVTDLRARHGPQTERALQRLADMQFVEVDARCDLRSVWDLWRVVQAARALPPGKAIFKVLAHPQKCDLIERLAAGPVLRKHLSSDPRSSTDVSKCLAELRLMKLLRSEENEGVVRLEEREKVLWIFLAVDQAFMDVHERGLQRHRNARTRHLESSGWIRQGNPRVRDNLPELATSPAVLEADPEVVDDPPGEYEMDLEREFEIGRIVFPNQVREVRLVGDYPTTKVEIEISSVDGWSAHVRRVDLWGSRFGLGPDVWRLPRPDITVLNLGRWAHEAVKEIELSAGDLEEG